MLVVLPTQLFPFKQIEPYIDDITVCILEEPRYFTDFKFHKLKIMYHRASMQKYKDNLIKKNITLKYIEFYKILYNTLKQPICY